MESSNLGDSECRTKSNPKHSLTEKVMTKDYERRTVNQESFHKWVGSGIVILSLAWASMAYFIKAEDNQTRSNLQSQINVLQSQQVINARVNELVFAIDKKLSNIENSLLRQAVLVDEVKELRTEVNFLKIELARKPRSD